MQTQEVKERFLKNPFANFFDWVFIPLVIPLALGSISRWYPAYEQWGG